MKTQITKDFEEKQMRLTKAQEDYVLEEYRDREMIKKLKGGNYNGTRKSN